MFFEALLKFFHCTAAKFVVVQQKLLQLGRLVDELTNVVHAGGLHVIPRQVDVSELALLPRLWLRSVYRVQLLFVNHGEERG